MGNPDTSFDKPINVVQRSGSPKPGTVDAAFERVRNRSSANADDERYIAGLQEFWQKLTAGSDLPTQLHKYIAVQSNRDYVLRQVFDAVGGTSNVPALKRAFPQFAQAVESELLSALVSNPEHGLHLWLTVVTEHQSLVEASAQLAAFHQTVARTLIDGMASAVVARVGKANHLSTRELLDISKIQVHTIVKAHITQYVQSTSDGLGLWHLTSEPDSVLNWIAGGGAAAGAAGSITTTIVGWPGLVGSAALVSGPGLVLCAAIGLLALGGGLGAWAAMKADDDATEAAKQQRAENAIKDRLRLAALRVADGLSLQADTLAMLFTADALGAKVDVKSSAVGPLDEFVWRNMFPKMPQQRTAAAQHVAQTVDDEIKAALAQP